MIRPTLRAVVFDMDGVIVNGEAAWHELYRDGDFLTAIAPQWTPEHLDELTGMSLPDLHEALTQRYGATLSYAEFAERFQKAGEAIYRERAVLMPDAGSTIRCLHGRGIPLAVASNSPQAWIDITLERFGLRDCFSAKISSDAVSAGKPAPDIYQEAVRRLGLNAAECCAVEDTDIGTEAASAAGLYAIGYRHADNAEQTFHAADAIINSLTELLDWAVAGR